MDVTTADFSDLTFSGVIIQDFVAENDNIGAEDFYDDDDHVFAHLPDLLVLTDEEEEELDVMLGADNEVLEDDDGASLSELVNFYRKSFGEAIY